MNQSNGITTTTPETPAAMPGGRRARGFAGDPVAARAANVKAVARRKELLQDPAYRARLGERISQGKAAREPTTCIVCGTAFTSPRSWLRAGYGKICSAGCRGTWKLQRRRGAGVPFDDARERLRQLGAAGWDTLPSRTREIVRLYYGLDDEKPWTQAAIGERVGLPRGRVQQIATSAAVRRLVSPDGALAEQAARRPRRPQRPVAKLCSHCGVRYEGMVRSLYCSPRCQSAADYAAHADARRAAKRASWQARRGVTAEAASQQPAADRGANPCPGHPCDRCSVCRRGLCCRGDDPERLPRLGDWDGPIHGELGVLDGDGDRVRCHACGEWFVQLGTHAVRTHGLRANVYKAIFGLNRRTGLAGTAYREQMRPHAEKVFKAYWPTAAQRLQEMTPEQRQAIDRERRLEMRRDPHNRQVWRESAHRGGVRIQELYAAGHYQPPLVREPALARRQAERMRAQLAADPALRAEFQRRLSGVARDGPEMVELVCVVCGVGFQAQAARVRAGQRTTCGPACARSRRAQTLRAHHPSRTDPEAWQERTRASARLQWQQTPRYRSIAVGLRALALERWRVLSETERWMLRAYYGLADEPALAQDAIGAQLGLDRREVSQRLHRVAAWLLGGEAVHAGGLRAEWTGNQECRICRSVRAEREATS